MGSIMELIVLRLFVSFLCFVRFCDSLFFIIFFLTNESILVLKSDSTHHFFRNACTKSLRFSQFSGCWLILSVYILMSFDFPFVRLLGVR
jgi:hypothetical protein